MELEQHTPRRAAARRRRTRSRRARTRRRAPARVPAQAAHAVGRGHGQRRRTRRRNARRHREPSRGSRPGAHGRNAAGATPTSDLAWRVGRRHGVAVNGQTFTGPDGVTLRAVDRARHEPGNGVRDRRRRSSTRRSDGVTWTHTSLGRERRGSPTSPRARACSTRSEPARARSRLGRLPAVDVVRRRCALGDDVGAGELHDAGSRRCRSQESDERAGCARCAHTTVVMAKASYSPDTTSADCIGHANYTGRRRLTASQMIDESVVPASEGPRWPRRARRRSRSVRSAHGSVVSTQSVERLRHHRPGTACTSRRRSCATTVATGRTGRCSRADADSSVQDVTATTNGFVHGRAGRRPDGGRSVQLWSSADGRTWTPLAAASRRSTPCRSPVTGSSESNSQTSDVSISNDGGVTWTATHDIAGLPAAVAAAGAAVTPGDTAVDAGPLGYAAVVRPASVSKTSSTSYLCTAATASTWKVTDLATVGAPADGIRRAP